MTCLCPAAIVVLPALLLLSSLGYAHHRARGTWRKEVIFWISVLLAFATVFVFASLAQRPGLRDTPAFLKATLLAANQPPLILLWWAALALGIVAVVASVIHAIWHSPARSPPPPR
jgi:hypothetical protein